MTDNGTDCCARFVLELARLSRGILRHIPDPFRAAFGAGGFEALALYYQTAEAHEGVAAFLEKRKPDFRKRKAGSSRARTNRP
jgi:1,4-dihydroxy-2-naphthoyl-CoA synthase